MAKMISSCKGKPTSEQIAIAKLDQKQRYICLDIHDREGVWLKKVLEQIFPENSKEILNVAQYMLTEGNVMYYYRD